MSKFLHEQDDNDDTTALAIPRVSSKKTAEVINDEKKSKG